LEHEVAWKTAQVSLNREVQALGRDLIQGGQIRINHDLLAPDEEDTARDLLEADDFGVRFLGFSHVG
jgi:hypothetical protein